MKDNGGPAFPATKDSEFPDRPPYHLTGMSLRDHFAGLAMQGMASNFDLLKGAKGVAKQEGMSVEVAVAAAAYEYADAMIAARRER